MRLWQPRLTSGSHLAQTICSSTCRYSIFQRNVAFPLRFLPRSRRNILTHVVGRLISYDTRMDGSRDSLVCTVTMFSGCMILVSNPVRVKSFFSSSRRPASKLMVTGNKATEVKIEWSSTFTPPLRLLGVDKDSFGTWLYNSAIYISSPLVLNSNSSIMSYKWSSPHNRPLNKQMVIKRLTWRVRVSV